MAGLLPNAVSPLTTPTYDGSGQVVHPHVIDFLFQHGMESWNGYRYWMVMTPFPASNDYYENPSLIASHDGLTWVEPPGLNCVKGTLSSPSFGPGNPLVHIEYFLDGTAHRGSYHYLPDPTMIYLPEEDCLWITFVCVFFHDDGGSKVLKYPPTGRYVVKVTGDLQTPLPVLTNWTPWVVFRDPPGKWHGLRQGSRLIDGLSQRCIAYTSSLDGITWAASTFPDEDCYHPWRLRATPLYPDHFGAVLREDGHTIDIVAATTTVATGGLPSSSLYTQLHYFHARLSTRTPTRWEYPYPTQPILESGGSTKWDQCLYQQSPLIDESTKTLRLWYSAFKNTPRVWGVGYTEGVLPDLPDLVFDSPPATLIATPTANGILLDGYTPPVDVWRKEA